MRFSGLVSGIDFDQVIEAILDIRRQPLLRLQEERTKLRLRGELWREIQQALSALQSALEPLLNRNRGLPFKVTSSDTTVVQASAAPIAQEGTYKVTVLQLATSVRITSGFADGATSISADPNNKVNPNGSLANEASKFRIAPATSGSFRINGVEITYSETDSLAAILQRINNSAAGVFAFYDPTADRVVLVGKQTGANSTITREDVSGNLLAALGLLDNAQVAPGQDALFTVEVNGYVFNDGNPIARPSNTVTDVLPGVTLQLVSAAPDKAVTVVVERDKSALKTAVKTFVEKFNAAVSLMYQRLTEKPVDDPQTDAERKVGLLRGDSTLVNLKAALVREATSVVSSLSSDLQTLAQLGIRLNNDGTLSLDENRLQQVLDTAPERVLQVFFYDADGDNFVDETDDGIAVRLKRQLDNWLSTLPVPFGSSSLPKGVVARQPALINQQIQDLDRRINELNERIEREGERLRRQFLAMEQQLLLLQQRWSFNGVPSFGGNQLQRLA